LLSATAVEPGLALAPGDKVSVKAYFDIRQANWCRRMIYQANV
jgi:hypothetical protein